MWAAQFNDDFLFLRVSEHGTKRIFARSRGLSSGHESGNMLDLLGFLEASDQTGQDV